MESTSRPSRSTAAPCARGRRLLLPRAWRTRSTWLWGAGRGTVAARRGGEGSKLISRRSSSRGPGDDGAWCQFAAGPRQAMQERGTMLCVTTAVAVVEDYTVAHGRVEALGNAGGEHRVIDTAVLHVPGRRIMSSTMPVTGTGVGPQGDMRVAT